MLPSSMTSAFTATLGLFSLTLIYICYHAANDVRLTVSPQGCRMSWMSPSYLLQHEFNSSWTPLAHRYSLWLYREVGWDPNQVMGVPVLFIPGNAGSSHQVRSIASSAARQYFSSPFVISSDFTGRGIQPLDFFAVEFNEDLSAFHGPTLDSQIEYSSAAIRYILSHYPPNTRIIVMGHSMGGIVGTALLPSDDISALITMSTPHTLPPARFDARIDEIYRRNAEYLVNDPTPVVSICGGATDMMIPSESCILPDAGDVNPGSAIYRRTIFTSALEGAWTGVGHREMVWCHQVRWRVARAALELGGANSNVDMAVILDTWLNRNGRLIPPATSIDISEAATNEALPEDMNLVLKKPAGFRTYLLPIPRTLETNTTFVLFVSRGSISSIGSQHSTRLQASPYFCVGRATSPTIQQYSESLSCVPLEPSTLKLLPSPIPGKPFPVPDEGSDESDGVVLFEATVPRIPADVEDAWIGVHVNAAGEDGWVFGGFDKTQTLQSDIGVFDILAGGAKLSLQSVEQSSMRRHITFPKLLSNALLIYKLTPRSAEPTVSCAQPILPPLLVHKSHPAETHYYRLEHDKPVAIHTHASAPFIPLSRFTPSHSSELWIYSSGTGCQDVNEFILTIDWWATIGRIATRYPTILISWSSGVVALLMFHAWRESGKGSMPSVQQSLVTFICRPMPKLLVASFVVALLPLSPGYYLGTRGESFLGFLAPVLLVVATGLVCVSWWFILLLMWPLRLFTRLLPAKSRQYNDQGMSRSTVVSIIFISLLVFLFVPWQIAFIGCWLIHLHTCANSAHRKPYPGSAPSLRSTPTESLPLRERFDGHEQDTQDAETNEIAPSEELEIQDMRRPQGLATITDTLDIIQAHHENTHLLLLMTWLLPLSMPVLAVWVRTLMTAGYTAPFNGDHNVFKVAPFLVLVDCTSRRKSALLSHGKAGSYLHWGYLIVACVSFLLGSREAYRVFDVASLFIGCALVVKFSPVRFARCVAE
ncbi:PGAP1-like protein-domain-containing protein [Suillus clintonianus]|uniref:PGAP1-like protein-domain-containing protein n=1 Tax=Suillus clintonianus TaxID=1904413 RepID=UPI001B870F75|nr:PGAP1-like protein-domain-containing protein [Suillus clintonianus]KAG2157116.1 PGAP1-like protein-domain-containing protein [Suillus clintonianus]